MKCRSGGLGSLYCSWEAPVHENISLKNRNTLPTLVENYSCLQFLSLKHFNRTCVFVNVESTIKATRYHLGDYSTVILWF